MWPHLDLTQPVNETQMLASSASSSPLPSGWPVLTQPQCLRVASHAGLAASPAGPQAPDFPRHQGCFSACLEAQGPGFQDHLVRTGAAVSPLHPRVPAYRAAKLELASREKDWGAHPPPKCGCSPSLRPARMTKQPFIWPFPVLTNHSLLCIFFRGARAYQGSQAHGGSQGLW